MAEAGLTKLLIAFDAYEIVPGEGRSIGIQNYTFRLLAAMAQCIPDGLELLVIANAANESMVREAVVGLREVRVFVVGPAPGKIRKQLWQCLLAAIELRKWPSVAAYFSPRGYLPYALPNNIRTIIVCHDLIRLWYSKYAPYYFSKFEHWLLCTGIKRAICTSDLVIAISRATAAEIAAQVPHANAITVVHNGIPIVVSSQGANARQPYFFAVTSDLPHKNKKGLLEGYEIYRKRHESALPLVVCGIQDGAQLGVKTVQGISDQELHDLYASAKGFIFCSFIEGFGFPPVEAMTHGTPVVCSDIPAHREITLGNAIYVDPYDPEAIARGISELSGSSGRVPAEVIDSIAASFNWPNCASGVWRAIESTLAPARH